MSTFKQTAVVLALAWSGPVLAQAPAPPPAKAAPAKGQGQLSGEQRSALGTVMTYNQILVGLGDLGVARGSTEEVKGLARGIADDQKAFAALLSDWLKQRGADPTTFPPAPDRQALQEEARQLTTRSGNDFDNAFLAFAKKHFPAFEDALKRAREATPGSDPGLKEALDHAEDAQEQYLSQARQLDQKRVQARTPPK
jgi:predicted outer membrane protein